MSTTESERDEPEGTAPQESGAEPQAVPPPSPPLFNGLSLIGLALIGVSATSIVFFVLFGLVTAGESGYSGLISLPLAVLGAVGLLVALLGAVLERRRRGRGERSRDPLQWLRTASVLGLATGTGVLTFLLLSAGTSAVVVVEALESNEFCGGACHSVMNPEATVYLDTAHARIQCVECHVGNGADSFLRAKISGLRQLYGVISGEISRPIPTPIRNRRSSREMCESCHTGDRLIGYKAIVRTYYAAESAQAPTRVAMLMNVGGGPGGLGPTQGIHYHMLFAGKVEFIARDRQRQEIPWVRVSNAEGEVREFSNEFEPLTPEERDSLEVRELECIDCHSRPAHRFPPPTEVIDEALSADQLPRSIPRIKEAGVRVLDGGYATHEEAMREIPERLNAFYADSDPEVLSDFGPEIERSAAALRQLYSRTIFPEMKADWRAHPDNLGHLDNPGCFRCHNDEMVSEDGEDTLFLGCTGCHVPLAADGTPVAADTSRSDASSAESDSPEVNSSESGTSDTEASDTEGSDAEASDSEGMDAEASAGEAEMAELGFVHPDDGEPFADDEFTLCSDCHDGGAELYD